MRRLFACHHGSHSPFLKELMSTAQVNVAAEVSQEAVLAPPGTTRTRSTPLTPAIPTGSMARVLVFQCLLVTNTESHGLLELDPRAQTPSSCEHPFPLREYSVQSRSVSILCQSLPSQRNLACCELLQRRQRIMFSPLHRLWAPVFLLLGHSRAQCLLSRQVQQRVREINSLMLSPTNSIRFLSTGAPCHGSVAAVHPLFSTQLS